MPNQNQPSPAATVVGHVAVGVVASALTYKMSKGTLAAVIVVALIAVLIHAALDAPVAKGLTQLGLA